MILNPLKNIVDFLKDLNSELIIQGDKSLSSKQLYFIGICITSMIFMGSFNFLAIQRATLGAYSAIALSAMLHRSKIPFSKLFRLSIKRLLTVFGVTEVHLIVDDFDRTRSKLLKKNCLGHSKLRIKALADLRLPSVSFLLF